MGASSVRFAHGKWDGERISYQTVRQEPNLTKGRCWDIDHLVKFCREAGQYAASVGASVGIDSWGVDHGFLDHDGKIVEGPVQYRDACHAAQFEELRPKHAELFQMTGIACQPFNTVFQLAARMAEDPGLADRADWYVMPDLLLALLTGVRGHELTQASTTQLMNLEGRWCPQAFEICGWPLPDDEPKPPGQRIVVDGTEWIRVASHDTASAVIGVGPLSPDAAYLNLGTWALLGVVNESPILTEAARLGGWTNEWAHDGRLRFLRNIPGLYVINRLREELGVTGPTGDWLASRDRTFGHTFDPDDPSLYNPDSMVSALTRLMGVAPSTDAEWAQVATASLIQCLAKHTGSLSAVLNRRLKRLRVVGGGSRSPEVCQSLADATGLVVEAGPDEATVLGNLAFQFATRTDKGLSSLEDLVAAGTELRLYEPKGEVCASI